MISQKISKLYSYWNVPLNFYIPFKVKTKILFKFDSLIKEWSYSHFSAVRVMIFLFRWSNLQINIFKSTLNYLKLWLKHAKIYNINLRKAWLTKCRLWPAFICFTINATMCLLVLHSCQHHTWHRWRAKHNRAGIPAGLRQGCGGRWPEGWIWWYSRWAGWSWEPCFECSTSLW